MLRNGMDQCVVDHPNVVPTEEGLSKDRLQHLLNTLPQVRRASDGVVKEESIRHPMLEALTRLGGKG